jgi:hypothetical protein
MRPVRDELADVEGGCGEDVGDEACGDDEEAKGVDEAASDFVAGDAPQAERDDGDYLVVDGELGYEGAEAALVGAEDLRGLGGWRWGVLRR